ncbi:hypothetical protein F1C76_08085 [Geodermatophilaceae bacterium NBWT11]|nr:hypothetical protein F1C76_08085 [Geodermatophilaceae bacterium NBWT11]
MAERLPAGSGSDDLAEVCGLYENRHGRKDLVSALRIRLQNLTPTQGMLALPAFSWRAIFTTNFDRLVEESYRLAGRDLRVVRSNYEYTSRTGSHTDVVLYKMHGCVSQDTADGSNSRMLLTENDYDSFAEYRQSMFDALRTNMYTGDTLIIGQSLRDHHLRAMAKDVAALRTQGVQGRVFLLAYDYEESRAQLFEQRGIQVAGGSFEAFLHELDKQQGKLHPAFKAESAEVDALPPGLATSTMDAKHASNLAPNPGRLFNGSPATYADIKAGLTISRAVETRLKQTQDSGVRSFFLVLSGAAGVGKTSLARRLMYSRLSQGFSCWEHLNNFPLDAHAWLEVEARLRSANRQGILLVDDCAQNMAALNRLVDGLGAIARPHLRIVVTVNAAQWRTKMKSSYFYSRGSIEKISLLTDGDISEMVNLVDRVASIRQLVNHDFLHLGHKDKIRRLRDRCNADMFVCLKNIFANERLDEILLQEFADLDESSQTVYRHVAVLQSMGGRVHRQLIMRLLGLEAGGVQTLLGQMEEVVDEYDVDVRMGLYGWVTRHDVIAQVIATYKYADQVELLGLLTRLIDGLNPTIHLEMETARSIASHDMGINRLIDVDERVQLLEKLIAKVPGERIPRRRLVRLLIDQGSLDDADRAIQVSRRDLGQDQIIERYRALLAIARAEQKSSLMPEDRLAMVLEAERLIRSCVARSPKDRYNYRVMGQVGEVLYRLSGSLKVLEDAIALMASAEAQIADPDFASERRSLETKLRRLAATAVANPESVDHDDDIPALADADGDPV